MGGWLRLADDIVVLRHTILCLRVPFSSPLSLGGFNGTLCWITLTNHVQMVGAHNMVFFSYFFTSPIVFVPYCYVDFFNLAMPRELRILQDCRPLLCFLTGSADSLTVAQGTCDRSCTGQVNLTQLCQYDNRIAAIRRQKVSLRLIISS